MQDFSNFYNIRRPYLQIRQDGSPKLENKQQISISDAARLLNVSRPTIYKLIDEGTLSPIRISARVIRIKRTSPFYCEKFN